MNQRIKELAKEAAVVYQKTLPPATHTTPLYLIDKLGKDAKDAGIEIISDGFCEKFAELIVRECAKVADEGLSQVTMKVEWPSYHIRKHFGVEE